MRQLFAKQSGLQATVPSGRRAGLSLVEVAVTMTLITVIVAGLFSAVTASQQAFLENQITSLVESRAHMALDRIISVASQAVTVDAEFSPLKPNTGVASHCLRFRALQAFDVAGTPIYDDTLKVYIYGPDTGTNPCAGLIIARGPDLPTIYSAASGGDYLLGTVDDDVTASIAGGMPAVELLLSADLAPQTGEMLTIDVTPAPVGRLLRFTLRVNATDRDGAFLLPNDLVLSERVALRQ